MRAAAIEEFLKSISELQKKNKSGATVAAIAQANDVSDDQAKQSVAELIDRGLVQTDTSDTLKLSAYGLRRLLTESIEDYLVAIYRLSKNQEHDRVTTSAIAQALGVSAPSVTSMTQNKLTTLELVEYERHRGVTLTPLGERISLQILRHHRIVELYLSETLGLPWDKVHDEANRLEHAMSPMLIERMAATLGDPVIDPHGDPIPSIDGTVIRPGLIPLCDISPGQTVSVDRIRDQSPEILRHLSAIGLVLGASVKVLAHAPLSGPLTVRVGETQQVLGRDLAHVILVTPPPGE